MSTNQPSEVVRLRYEDLDLRTAPGSRLLDAILAAGVNHRHLCGGNGFCTSCRVEVSDGGENLSAVSPLERQRLGPEAGRLRLACQTRLWGDAAVRPARPLSSRFSPDES